ncbi:hypothetical protein DSAG12_00489 [Promethearchaeum syntrophicum]|uniref:Uncharacterized protein n=1 Tax=Promethearchaeum syntrophicum TaxID=2594042 RepID=A0A5B9D7W8_9ARCH|nr:hypothetical protein [Candidatus Prometheoarchaeum syntrophicum]QEE14676.1 hypothetical protein DSAG12_00489 [Candidatus Prometheoarchaeum syntrophicum]
MKSKNILKFGIWIVLISALVISLFLIPNLAEYTFSVLMILTIFALAKLRERLGVRKKLSAEQVTNASLGNRSMQ